MGLLPVVAGGLIPAIAYGGCFGFRGVGRGRAGGLGFANHPKGHGHRGCWFSWGAGWTRLKWAPSWAPWWPVTVWPDLLLGLRGLVGLALGLAVGLAASLQAPSAWAQTQGKAGGGRTDGRTAPGGDAQPKPDRKGW